MSCWLGISKLYVVKFFVFTICMCLSLASQLCQECQDGFYNLVQDLSPCHKCPDEGVICSSTSIIINRNYWPHQRQEGTLLVDRCPPGLFC